MQAMQRFASTRTSLKENLKLPAMSTSRVTMRGTLIFVGHAMQHRYRPSWIVLSPVSLDVARAAAEAVWFGHEAGDDPDDSLWDLWRLVDGHRGYVAVYTPEPGAQRSGHEAEIATRLSRDHTGPHYVLTLAPYAADPDHGVDDIDVYEHGIATGRLGVFPAGRVATHFGCAIPHLDRLDLEPLGPHDLQPFARPPVRRPDERTLLGDTIAGWAYALAHDSFGLELGLEPKDFAPAVDALGDADPEVRRIAARLLYYGRPYADWLERLEAARRTEHDSLVKTALDDAIEYWREWLE
jgi:hypothetical protein